MAGCLAIAAASLAETQQLLGTQALWMCGTANINMMWLCKQQWPWLASWACASVARCLLHACEEALKEFCQNFVFKNSR